MNTTMERLVLFVAVFLSVLYLPWWLTLVFLICMSYYFPFYMEIIFFGFIFDKLFLASREVPYTALALSVVILIIVSFIRRNIRR